jgi:DNA processing protein
MEQGRLVFAVPGRIDQATSQGCHQLIRDGAILFTDVDDILQELSYLNGLRPNPIPANTKTNLNEERPRIGELMPEEDAVFQCFEGGAIVAVDEITDRTNLTSAQVSSTLMMLELKRLIAKRSDGRFEARTD